jgi:ABC-type proline/glycine betaine transport system permease subunit
MIVQPLVDAYRAVEGWVTAFNAALNPYTNWYFTQLHGLLPEPFFNTQAFLLFFAAIFCVYWLVPRRWEMTRIWLLILASFHFYASWSKDLAFLVTTTTFADYIFGRLMGISQRQKVRFLVMMSSITMNLGVLCYFKYRLLPQRTARLAGKPRIPPRLRQARHCQHHHPVRHQLLHLRGDQLRGRCLPA